MADITCPCCSAAIAVDETHWVAKETVDAAMAHLLKMHDQRVTELLTSNNELLKRCRQADRDTIQAREVARKAIVVAGEMAKYLPEGKL